MTAFESPQKISLRMWFLAATAALAFHLGCAALAFEYLRDDDPEDELGAPAIEISVELLAKRVDPTDLPPGPDVEASVASPRIIEQREIVEPTDLPRAVPTETDDPDRVVAPVETEKPEKDQPNVPAVPAIASVESVAVEATAAPSSETIRESVQSVTPVQGSGESPQRVRASWQKELIAHFNRHKRYPGNRSSQAVELLVSFVLDETGRVVSTGIVHGSGDAAFDDEALAMIRRSDPVPKPPSVVTQQGLHFTLPVYFRAKRGN
jgi:periplasmic protein TonB